MLDVTDVYHGESDVGITSSNMTYLMEVNVFLGVLWMPYCRMTPAESSNILRIISRGVYQC